MTTPPGAPAAGDRQVCVVGGGVGGLTAAALLSRRGHHPTVVAPTVPAGVSHALSLWPGALAVLDDAFGDALDGATAVESWRVRVANGDRRHEAGVDSGTPPLRVLDRARFREALRGRLPPASLRVSKTPTAIDPDPSGPVVEFADGVRERFDLVVGADGRRSRVRAATFDGDPLRSPETTTWSFRAPAAPAGYGTLTDVWGSDSALLLGPTRSPVGLFLSTGRAGDAASLTDALRRSTPGLPRGLSPGDLHDAVRLDDRVGWATRWVADGVALLGDAAHAVHPCLALGGSLAVEAAAVLAAELSRDAPATALRRYERRCRGRIAALARSVAVPDRSVPFPVDGFLAARTVRTALVASAVEGGPGSRSGTASGRS